MSNSKYHNRQITSREFKLMLKPGMFDIRDKTIEGVVQVIEARCEDLGCSFKRSNKPPEEVKTMYLDTRAHDLYRKFNFFLRIREKPNECDITLKCRHQDRYMAASYELSDPVESMHLKFKGYKFEEDVTTSEIQSTQSLTFHSKFSSQAKFESKKKPELDRFQKIKSMYPDLQVRILPEEDFTKVNEFEANEISWSLGHVIVPDGNEIKSEMSLWYSSDKDKKPVIVELDFDCKAIKLPDEASLEQFPFSMIESINHLYASLQGENIVDLSMSKTKTEFAYNNLKKI